MCGFGGALALAGALVGHTISYHFAATVGSKSVDSILTMLASSMLAVTTFSLSTMVSAYSTAGSSATPRAAILLVEDSIAQRALATFIGVFLFSVVGLIALSTGIYGDSGRLVLFGVTIVMIVVIVVTLLRWIEQLSHLGRVAETIDRVERAARHALLERAARLIKEQGLNAALPVLHDPSAGFMDRDLFVFGIGRDGVHRFVSTDPEATGQQLPMLASRDGGLLHEALWRAADSGQQWVEYQSCDPETLEMVPKLACVLKVDEDLLLGSPLHKQTDDGLDAPAMPAAHFFSSSEKRQSLAAALADA